jgi:DNA-binding transcriptional ArsR family regulator
MKCERDIFQAVADPTKRTIIVLLTLGSMSTNALAEHFDSNRQAMSKNLKVLTECNLIKLHQRGREFCYLLETDKMKDKDQ